MSFLGGFYIYRVGTITIADAAENKTQTGDITGVVLFKDIGANGDSQVIFGYFPIPENIIQPNGKKPSQAELAGFNPINEFITTTHYDTPNNDKGIYYYNPANLEEFLRKCYIPPISPPSPPAVPV
jgi:hypothetical protein